VLGITLSGCSRKILRRQTAVRAAAPSEICPRHRRQHRDVPLKGFGQTVAASAPAGDRSLSVLFAEMVELGREAWRIRERERAVRAEIEALREIEESQD
jgi:hypothetical protein